MGNEVPIACSLGPEDYRNRLEAIREMGARALVGIDELSDGIRLAFRDSQETQDELQRLVEAERTCCPFLTLETTARRGELLLAIAAPPEAKPIVDDLVFSFGGGADIV
jgi:hypothetical protein